MTVKRRDYRFHRKSSTGYGRLLAPGSQRRGKTNSDGWTAF